MKVTDLFRNLSHGVLSNLALAGDGNGTIVDAAQPKIILYTNEGLLRLYGRFVLKTADLLLEQQEHITFYHLLPKFSQQYVPGSGEASQPYRYILDLPREKFEGDVIKVLEVYTSEGQKLPLNDTALPFSLFTPQAELLQVPSPVHGQVLSVVYQAKHKLLSGELEEEVVIPDILLGALTSYVAYNVFSHMNTAATTQKAQEHLANYESVCAEASRMDLTSASQSQTNTRFEARGWI
jgi:hypothetical protein